MSKKTVFITGANGFAGKHLTEYLKSNYTLLAPSRKDLDLLNQREVDDTFKSNKIDVVVHTALVGGSRKEEEVESALAQNLRMLSNIVKNKNKFKKLIHFGSGAEYDKRYPIRQVKEDYFGKSIPIDEYGFAKYISSKLIEGIDNAICLRIFALFGPGEDYRYRFISNAICRNIFGMPITIRQDVYFDYIYIEDFVRIVEFFINNKPKHKFYNIGTGTRINIKRIAETINEISDKKSKITVKKRGLNNEYTSNNKRLVRELGGFLFTKPEEYIADLYKWYKENKRLINPKLI